MDYPIDKYIIYITAKQQACTILQEAMYCDPSLNTDGFIHFCSYHQVNDVVASFYAQTVDLTLLIIDINLLQSELHFEAPVGNISMETSSSQLFPHLYGPLNVDAIIDVVDLKQFNHNLVHA